MREEEERREEREEGGREEEERREEREEGGREEEERRKRKGGGGKEEREGEGLHALKLTLLGQSKLRNGFNTYSTIRNNFQFDHLLILSLKPDK